MADDGITFRMELDSSDAEAALDRLRDATEGVKGALEKLAQAFETGGFSLLEKTALAATAAVAAVTTALFASAKAASETTKGLADIADQTGSTVEEMSALQGALVELGARPESLQRAFERFGNTIQEVFPGVVKSIQSASASAEEAQINLQQASAKLEATQAGVEVPPALQRELNIKRDLLAVDKARIAVAEEHGNNIQTLIKYVDALSAGASTAGIKAEVTVDNLIKGLVGSVGPAVQQLQGLGGSLGDIAQKAPAPHAALLKLADVFKNIQDIALKTAVATKLFGKDTASNMVTALSVGSAALKEMEDRSRALGLVLTEDDKKVSEQFTRSMNRLGEVIGMVATQFGLLFGEDIASLMTSITTAFENNRATIIAWGKSVSEIVRPVMATIGRVLRGQPQAGTDDWLVTLIHGFELLGQAAVLAINGLVIPTLQGLLQMANGIAFGINKVFGTAFTGLEIILVAFFSRMALALATMLVGMGPIGAAIIGIGLALGLLIQYWPQIKAAALDAGNAIESKWTALKATLDAWVTTPVGNAWQWIVDTFWEAVGAVHSAVDTVNGWIRDWVTTPIANAWQWIADTFKAVIKSIKDSFTGGGATAGSLAGHAAGGVIGGRGSGTSDSNLAWVSRGEHIMPAYAVRQPGVLAFLEALRRSGGDLSRVLDGIGRYAAGGQVRLPALASAGTGSMSNVTIQFPGLPSIGGLQASSLVVEELQRAAAMAQVRSGGRKPSRYR